MSATTPLPSAKAASSVRKVIVASLVGTSLEWYDFFIYGTAQFVLIMLAAIIALIFHATMYGPQAALI